MAQKLPPSADTLSKKIGLAAILAASIIWAIEPVVAKLAYKNGATVAQTSGVCTLGSLKVAFAPGHK